jgi:23S rRNA pseudouridine2605 synthase
LGDDESRHNIYNSVPIQSFSRKFVIQMPQPAKSFSLDSSNSQRLQRVMAAAGVGSRRECELIILEGRVEVDGQIVATLGTKVDPNQKIYVDGQRITLQRLEYYMLNKPPGVVSTSNDPAGRARVIDLIKTEQRVYNVGRLDQSSEGLILVTNDGELANRLTHPKYGIEKKYHVKVDGVPTPQQLRSLEEGIYIAEGKAQAKSAKLLRKTESYSWVEMVLSEGKNREIRRILAKLGHKVRVLKRVAIGPLKLADLPVGAHRRLTFGELKELRRAAEGLGPIQKSSVQKSRKSGKDSKFRPQTIATNSTAPARDKKFVSEKFKGDRDARKPRESRTTETAGRDGKTGPTSEGSRKVGSNKSGLAKSSRKRRSGPKQISELTKFTTRGRQPVSRTGARSGQPNHRDNKKGRGR